MSAVLTGLRRADRERLIVRLRELDDLDRERGRQQPPPANRTAVPGERRIDMTEICMRGADDEAGAW